MPVSSVSSVVNIPRIDIRHMNITLIGDSPLIVHKWSEKAKKEMLDKQMKAPRMAKEAKDPEAQYQDSLYRTEDGGYGFPAIGFKAAAVSACRYADMKMTEARGAFHINQELVEILGPGPTMREDMVKIAMGTADIRYRGEFKKWWAIVPLRFNGAMFSPEQIINLFNIAGFGVGVGEWRPERDGSYGMFHVGAESEVAALP